MSRLFVEPTRAIPYYSPSGAAGTGTWVGPLVAADAVNIALSSGNDCPIELPYERFFTLDMNLLHVTLAGDAAPAAMSAQLIVEDMDRLTLPGVFTAADASVVAVIEEPTTFPTVARMNTRDGVADGAGTIGDFRLHHPITFDLLKVPRGDRYRYHLALVAFGGATDVILQDIRSTTWKES